MFRMIGALLIALAATGAATTGLAQQAPATKGAVPPAGPAAASPIPGANDVLATVTSHGQTDKVTKADVVNFLSRYPLPAPEDREIAYKTTMDMLANTMLVKHFLLAQRIQVPENRVDEQIEQVRQQLKKQGQDLEAALNQSGSSLEEMRKEIANTLRFDEFVRSRATDPALRRYLNENRDRFARTQVRASHIMLRVPPDATKEQKEKIKQKLEQIRQEIVGGKLTFAAAANKYSEDPANAGGAGGDLDYFTLDMGFVEEFADAAFKMKKGEISQPVETPYGYHLIQVTDRKEGKLPEFEQFKVNLAQFYRAKLQKDIVEDERKTAKIDIQPMPKDLFPSEPPAAAGAPAATAPAAGAAGAPAAPKP